MDLTNRITALLEDSSSPSAPAPVARPPEPRGPRESHASAGLQPSPHSSQLLRLYLDGALSLLDICDQTGCSLEELDAWTESDWAQSRFALIRKLAALRDELLLADAIPQARQTLIHLATIADPAESASSRESRRKAARQILTSAPAPSPRSPAHRPPQAPTPSRPGALMSRPLNPLTPSSSPRPPLQTPSNRDASPSEPGKPSTSGSTAAPPTSSCPPGPDPQSPRTGWNTIPIPVVCSNK